MHVHIQAVQARLMTERYRTAGILMVLLAISVFPAARAAELDATELARTLQNKYDRIKDFSSDFVHTYEGGVLRKKITERGRLLVKKPGRMRWEYTTPEQKLFVSDGLKMYSY